MVEMQTLEAPTISKDSTGLVTFDAQAPELTLSKLGSFTQLEDYPFVRGSNVY
jgi:hypothetical protein